MLDWIRAIIEGLWDRLIPFVVVHSYQAAGVFRFGKYHRTLQGGKLHWKWPLAEDIVSENICLTTLALEPQTIMTKDDKTIVVTGIVRYRIVDVRPFICEIGNQHDLLRDTSMGAVLKQVRKMELRSLLDESPESKIAADIRRQVKDYGVSIEAFTFTDSAPIKTYRIMTHTHLPEHLL